MATPLQEQQAQADQILKNPAEYPLSLLTATKVLSRYALAKSFTTNMYLGQETIKAYGKEVLRLAAAAAPEAAQKILATKLD